MGLHPEGKSCSDLGRVLVLNDPPAWQLIVADPALNLKEKLKGLRTNWALRTGQGLSADDKKDELVKVSALARMFDLTKDLSLLLAVLPTFH